MKLWGIRLRAVLRVPWCPNPQPTTTHGSLYGIPMCFCFWPFYEH
jgi:hypothetical protein